ncbi:hypothetical protein AMTRI_Chr03g54650 [Amborella trichopoda]
MFQHTTLTATIGLAYMQEDKLQHLGLREKNQFNWQRATVPFLWASKTGIIKKLTWAEMECRDKDICHNCDEKFVPNHWCKSQKLFMLDDDADWGEDDWAR